jgi:hypothetical protein
MHAACRLTTIASGRWRKMDIVERCFVAMAIAGFIGLVASVTWLLLS